MAIDWNHASNNPLRRVRFFKVSGKKRFLSIEEIHKLLDTLNKSSWDYLRMMVLIALNTGMRRGEVLSIQYKNIDWKHKMITIEQTKTPTEKTLEKICPMNTILYRELKKYIKEKKIKEGKLFDIPSSTIVAHFKELVIKSDIEYCTFHTLRHTFCSQLNLQGVDLRTIQLLAGHKKITTTAQYTHLLQPHIQKATEVISRLLTNNKLTEHK